MEQQFKILKATRSNVLKVIDGLSLEQLNNVPFRFKNNIIWNIGHILVTQQLLCYKLSGLELTLDKRLIDRYKKGSGVELSASQEEVEFIKENLLTLPEQLKLDYNNGLFVEFSEYLTSYNVILNTIEDAIQFNNVHEGVHFGYILAMKKLV